MGAEAGMYLGPAGGGQTVHELTLLGPPAVRSWMGEPETRSRRDVVEVGCVPRDLAVKTVLFDAENVLYDASGWYRWLAQIFARTEPRGLEAEFLPNWRGRLLPLVQCGACEFHDAVIEGLRAIGLAAAHVEEIVAASRAQRRRQEASLRTLPGVQPTLRNLHSVGIELGILANIDQTASMLGSGLERMGIGALFAHVLTSLDLGANLPERRCYEAAVAAANRAAGEVLFVGNEAAPLRGAQLAGLRVVAFNAHDNVGDVGHLHRFEELQGLIMPATAAGPIKITAGQHPTGQQVQGRTS
jgi:FMN phosphatase YigB (HAD superfamily)